MSIWYWSRMQHHCQRAKPHHRHRRRHHRCRRVRHAPAGSCDSRLVAAEAEAPPLTIKKRSTINKAALDGTLTAALRLAAPRRRFVLLTFGNLAVRDHLLNFCKHAAKIRASHIVGAVDKAAFELLAAQQTPAYKTPLAFEEYALDGSNSHASSSWKRFASMRTGEVARIVWLGYHVLHTDTDVVWLRDPMPYLMCTEEARSSEHAETNTPFPCAPMMRADVAVSSDNMGPRRALNGRGAYHAAGTFNSGILLFRPTPSGKAFVRQWHENVANPKRGSRFYGRTSDQQVFNAMVRKERQWPGVGGRRDDWLMRDIHSDWEGNLTLGALPLPLFANGHGYFVQSAHERLHVHPYAVHATYSLDWHDGTAKAQRFREAGLWEVDEERYFEGKYLAVNASTPPDVLRLIEEFKSRGVEPNNIGTHAAALRSYLHELRDALALARALDRILILPRWTCYCDKLWAGSDDILRMKCMYPGSQDDNFLPFNCPMDHVLSPHDWKASKVDYRDAAFLTSHRLSQSAKNGIVDVTILPVEDYERLPSSKRINMLPGGGGLSANEARRLLGRKRLREAPILRLPHTRDLLCAYGGAGSTRAFNTFAKPLLRAPNWCARCEAGCRKQLPTWLSEEQIKANGRGWGEWCLRTPSPPLFAAGGCRKSV